MSKESGLGDACYVGGYDLGGDIGALSRIGGGSAVLDVTPITASAPDRLGGVRDGSIEYMAYFNPAASQAHPVLSALPTANQIVTYCRGTTLGNASACLVGKQIDYPGTRGQDGSLTFAISTQAAAYGLQWGRQLTAGTRTDTAATNGSSIDTTASASFGAAAFLHVTAFSGTDVTITIQDSANDSAWLDVASFVFTAVTSAPTSERIALAATATVRRYLRVITSTSGGFTSVSFQVTVCKNTTLTAY